MINDVDGHLCIETAAEISSKRTSITTFRQAATGVSTRTMPRRSTATMRKAGEIAAESPGGTITRSVFDDLGRFESQWVGTDDTPTSGDWSPTNNSGANMVKVVEYEYDGGARWWQRQSDQRDSLPDRCRGGQCSRNRVQIRLAGSAGVCDRPRRVFEQGALLASGAGQHGPGHQERAVLGRRRR